MVSEELPLILFVGPKPPPIGGVAEAMERLAAAPEVTCYRTDVFNTSDGELTAPVGPKRLSFRTLRRRIRLVYRLARQTLRQRPDIVHYHFGSESFLNEIADFLLMYAGGLTGARVVLHLHLDPSTAALPGKGRAGQWLFRMLARRASGTFVLTERDKHFLEQYGLATRIAVLPNTCDERLTGIGHSYKQREPLRILFVGRLTKAKGFSELLDVATKAREIIFEVAGLTTSADEQKEIDAIVSQRGLTNVRFHGLVRDDEKIRLFTDSDAVFMPSHAETFGITAIEGMAAALPVVATRVGGLASVIDDGSTGILVEKGDVDGFLSALQRLAGSPELRAQYGRAGRERFISLYSAQRVGSIAAGVYREVLNS